MQTESDGIGVVNKPNLGELPGIGTRLIINGNTFRICYVRHNPFRITCELVKKYDRENDNNAPNH